MTRNQKKQRREDISRLVGMAALATATSLLLVIAMR